MVYGSQFAALIARVSLRGGDWRVFDARVFGRGSGERLPSEPRECALVVCAPL